MCLVTWSHTSFFNSNLSFRQLTLKMSFWMPLIKRLINISLISFSLIRLMFDWNRRENITSTKWKQSFFSTFLTFRIQTHHVTPQPPTAPTWAAHRALHPHTRARLSLWSAANTWAGRHELYPCPLPSDVLWGPETESRLLIRHIPKHAAGPRCVCLRVLVCTCITRVNVLHTHITVHLTSLLSGPITTVPVLDGGTDHWV